MMISVNSFVFAVAKKVISYEMGVRVGVFVHLLGLLFSFFSEWIMKCTTSICEKQFTYVGQLFVLINIY